MKVPTAILETNDALKEMLTHRQLDEETRRLLVRCRASIGWLLDNLSAIEDIQGREMKPIDLDVKLIQPLIAAKAVAKRRNKATGRTEFLLTWTGAAGDTHEVWYDEAFVKIED